MAGLMGSSGGLSSGKLKLATATQGNVLSGKTFYSGGKDLKTGTMTNNGGWSSIIAPGGSIIVPQGYHNGNGRVTANSARSGDVLGIYGGHCPSTDAWFEINRTYNSEYMSSGKNFSKSCTIHIHIQFGHSPYLNSIIIQVAGQTLFNGEANGNHVIDRDIVVNPGNSIYIAQTGGGQTQTYFLCVTTLA